MACALLALLAPTAAARLTASGPFQASLRTLDPSPAPFDFGRWPVNHVSDIQTFTFTYNGSNSDGTAIQSDPSISGGNASDFTLLPPQADSNDCAAGFRVFQGSSCDVRVQFSPLSSGVKSTTLHVVDDDGCGCGPTDNTVDLSGTGALPTRSPASLSFGDQPVGTTSAAKTVTVSNTSKDNFNKFGITAPTGDFTRTTDCPSTGTLAPGASCHVFVKFAPTAPGTRSGKLTITSDSGNVAVSLTGNGTVHLAHAPSSLAFGNQRTGSQSATKNVTFTNDSGGNVTPGAATVTGTNAGQFAIASNGCTAAIAPGASCVIGMRFKPTTIGAKTAALNLASNSTGSPDVIPLSGTGTVHLAHAPSSLAFGNQRVGTQSAVQNITFTNDSGAPVTPGASSLTGGGASQFSKVSNGCTSPVAPGDTCVIGVRFKPTAIGARSAALELTSNSTSSPDVIPLTGTGTVHLAHAPASLAFGNQVVSTQSAVQNVTFTNDSGAPVTPGAATVTGADAAQFAIASNSCTSPIAAGAKCVIGMLFQPTATGPRSAALRLSSNSLASPDVIALSGTGTAPASAPSTAAPGIAFDVSTLNFGARIVKGGHLKRTLKLTNTGALPLVISTIAITGPDAADFSLAAATRATTGCAPTTLAPGSSCSVDVSFLAGATGDRTASLVITDNAPGSPHSLGLLGSGLPPPVLYRTANAEPVSGDVTVALPPTAGARASILKGRRFIPLKEARQVPIGTIFNTKKGRVRIATATTKRAKTQAGQFFAGLFQVLQRRSEKGLTEARLVGSNFKSCTARTGKTSARIAKKKKINKDVIRTLRANVKGKFRTRGRFAAATVRGTIWSMQDRCDGTLTRVTRGTVVVRNLRTQRNIVVRTGKSAFVPKP